MLTSQHCPSAYLYIHYLPTTIYSPRVLTISKPGKRWWPGVPQCSVASLAAPELGSLSSPSLWLFVVPSFLPLVPYSPALCSSYLCTCLFPTSQKKNESQTAGVAPKSQVGKCLAEAEPGLSCPVLPLSTRPVLLPGQSTEQSREEGSCLDPEGYKEEPLTLASQVPTLV